MSVKAALEKNMEIRGVKALLGNGEVITSE